MAATSSINNSKQSGEAAQAQTKQKRAWTSPIVIVESVETSGGGYLSSTVDAPNPGTAGPS